MAQANAETTTKAAAADPARLRARIAVAVEKLISALDALDRATEDMEDDDPGEANNDDEPSLGSNENRSQTLWAEDHVGGDDRERDDADGPEGDDEREEDPAELGIADADGLMEQRQTCWDRGVL